MNTVRNFIHVVGLSNQEEIKTLSNGYVYEQHDKEYIYLPTVKPSAKSIFQIILNTKVTSNRIIETFDKSFLGIDGYKEFKIIYTEDSELERSTLSEIKIPFNSYVEIKEKNEVDKIEVFPIDAFFELVEGKRIYSSILYLINIGMKDSYSKIDISRKFSKCLEVAEINLEPRYFEKFEELLDD